MARRKEGKRSRREEVLLVVQGLTDEGVDCAVPCLVLGRAPDGAFVTWRGPTP